MRAPMKAELLVEALEMAVARPSARARTRRSLRPGLTVGLARLRPTLPAGGKRAVDGLEGRPPRFTITSGFTQRLATARLRSTSRTTSRGVNAIKDSRASTKLAVGKDQPSRSQQSLQAGPAGSAPGPCNRLYGSQAPTHEKRVWPYSFRGQGQARTPGPEQTQPRDMTPAQGVGAPSTRPWEHATGRRQPPVGATP